MNNELCKKMSMKFDFLQFGLFHHFLFGAMLTLADCNPVCYECVMISEKTDNQNHHHHFYMGEGCVSFCALSFFRTCIFLRSAILNGSMARWMLLYFSASNWLLKL